jgi:hypothetical protein
MKRIVCVMVGVTAAIFIAGCATNEKPAVVVQPLVIPAGVPRPIEIELRAVKAAERRATYYKLDADGTLTFGGGIDANLRTGSRAGRLTGEQIAQLWSIIDGNKLLDAGGKLFASGKVVSYEVRLRAGDRKANYGAVDDGVKGLDQLEGALFKMQSDLRYKDVFKPIDEKLRKSGGAVKRDD